MKERTKSNIAITVIVVVAIALMIRSYTKHKTAEEICSYQSTGEWVSDTEYDECIEYNNMMDDEINSYGH